MPTARVFGPKKLGCCLGCGRECYVVVSRREDGPVAGEANRLGPMLPHAVQVGFLMSDGTQADVTFCRPCAHALRPADYQAVWDACLARGLRSLEIAGRPPAAIVRTLLPTAQIWPIAVVYWRQEDVEMNRLALAMPRVKPQEGSEKDA